MAPNRCSDQTCHTAVGRRLQVVAAAPVQYRGVEMLRLMIPGYHLLTEPGGQGTKVGHRGGADTQGGAELPTVALPCPTLPRIVGDRRRLYRELRREILQGDGRDLFGGQGKAAFEVEKLQRGGHPQATAGVTLWKQG